MVQRARPPAGGRRGRAAAAAAAQGVVELKDLICGPALAAVALFDQVAVPLLKKLGQALDERLQPQVALRLALDVHAPHAAAATALAVSALAVSALAVSALAAAALAAGGGGGLAVAVEPLAAAQPHVLVVRAAPVVRLQRLGRPHGLVQVRERLDQFIEVDELHARVEFDEGGDDGGVAPEEGVLKGFGHARRVDVRALGQLRADDPRVAPAHRQVDGVDCGRAVGEDRGEHAF